MISPQNLGRLGIFDSLTDTDPIISSTALLEVTIFRGLSIIIGVALGSLYCCWDSVSSSKIVSSIMNQKSLSIDETRKLWCLDFKIFLSCFVLLILATIYLGWINKAIPRDVMKLIEREDGIFEWISTFLFLTSGILSFSIASKIGKNRGRALYCFIGIFFLLCFLEEISWGQRILKWESPEFVMKYNVQEETNLHNFGGYFIDHLFIVFVFLYGFFLPVLYRSHLFFYNLIGSLRIPIASLGLALGFFLVSFYHDWMVALFINDKARATPEIRELLTAALFVLLMLETKKRINTET